MMDVGSTPRNTNAARLLILGGVFAAFLAFLVGRLWHVQVRHGREHVSAIQRQSIRRIRIAPVRGRILASDGTLLIDNEPVYDVVFHVSEMRQPGRRSKTVDYIQAQSQKLAATLGRDSPLSTAKIDEHLRYYPAMPLIVFTRLDDTELAQTVEALPPVPGLEVVPRIVRHYPFPAVATHVLGFTGRTQPTDRFELRKYSYLPRELRGRNGLELHYDEELTGRGGAKLVRVNTLGYVHEQVSTPILPRNGKDLILTLDTAAQRAADSVMGEHLGALVVLNARTGAVLAMASSPTFDLNELTSKRYAELRADTRRTPLRNRAVCAWYAPGSIIKPLIAIAALEAGAIGPYEVIECEGAYRIGNRPIRCWRRSGHGPVDLTHALTVSCNPYFIHAGMTAGLRSIQPVLAAAGIGERPGIDLPSAGGGLLPSRAYAKTKWNRNWIAIDTAYLSIGQGAINLSPLQAAMFVSAIANGGTVFTPYLVQSIRSPDGFICRNAAPVVQHTLPVSKYNLELIRTGMWEAVNGADGTAKEARNNLVELSGKTGTAEVIEGQNRHKDTWFIGYGPADNPRYAIAVLVEHGDSGGHTAAPLAREFFTAWLSNVGKPGQDR